MTVAPDRIYRIEAEDEPGRYHGIIIHEPTGQRLEMRTLYATDSAARIAARTYLTDAINRGELPLSPTRNVPVWSPHGKLGTARIPRNKEGIAESPRCGDPPPTTQ